jgi:hypothetical protein
MDMFMRQFSVRWLMAATSICAMFFFLVAMAVNGYLWVITIVAGVAAFLVVMLVHAALFLLINLLPWRTTAETGDAGGTARPCDGMAHETRGYHTGAVP